MYRYNRYNRIIGIYAYETNCTVTVAGWGILLHIAVFVA